MTAGGDSRLSLDPSSGLNKYFVPPRPDPWAVCFSSCTASPISEEGFRRAQGCYRSIVEADGPEEVACLLRGWRSIVQHRLSGHLGTQRLADVVLLPSGTDGLLLSAILLFLEGRCRPVTAILPASAETGAGVPRAALRQAFDGPGAAGGLAGLVEVRLRDVDGELRDDGAVSADFAAAAKAAAGRPVVYLTHGSKTGLVAPLRIPRGSDVVVDAYQLRLAPSVIRRCLRRGWPVVVTGSKHLGGPPFSGAVLLPRGRFSGRVRQSAWDTWRQTVGPSERDEAMLGPLLRWVAAVQTSWFDARREADARAMKRRMSAAKDALVGVPGVRIMAGPSSSMEAASGMPGSILSFAVRGSAPQGRLMSAESLRGVHRALAARGVLLGQPVDAGPFGVLRLAFGMRDLGCESWRPSLERAAGALAEVLAAGQRSAGCPAARSPWIP